MVTARVGGRPWRLLLTHAVPGGLVDTWEALDRYPGNWDHVGVVVTVLDGQEVAADPFLAWCVLLDISYVDRPAEDPLERFLEAIRQGHERQLERLGSPIGGWFGDWPKSEAQLRAEKWIQFETTRGREG